MGSRAGQDLASGVVPDSTGNIVTNNHVVAGANSFEVILAGGATCPAQPVGSLPGDDLAVLRIAAPGLRPVASPTPPK